MEPEDWLQHSRIPTIYSYPEPYQLLLPPPPFLKIHFNIILQYTPRYSKWSPSLKFPHQNPICAYPLPHTCYVPRSSHSSLFWSPENYFVVFFSLLFLEHHQRICSICGCKHFVVPNNRTIGVTSCTPGSLVEQRGYGLSDHRVGTTRGTGTHPNF